MNVQAKHIERLEIRLRVIFKIYTHLDSYNISNIPMFQLEFRTIMRAMIGEKRGPRFSTFTTLLNV